MTLESWRNKVVSLASDRTHGAMEVTLDIARLFASKPVTEEISSAELKNGLVQIAHGQSAMAPVLRICGDLWNSCVGTSELSVEITAGKWIDAIDRFDVLFSDHLFSFPSPITEKPFGVFSYSSTLLTGLSHLRNSFRENTSILVPESRPGGEGATTAEHLTKQGWSVTVVPDMVFADMVTAGEVDGLLLGCDALCESRFVNKSGSGALASLVHNNGGWVELWTSTVKVLPNVVFEHLDWKKNQSNDLHQVQKSGYSVHQPLFGTGNLSDVTRIVTEQGVYRPSEIHGLIQSVPAIPDELLP